MYKLILTTGLALAAIVSSVPVEEQSSLICKKYGGPSGILGVSDSGKDGHDEQHFAFKPDQRHDGYAMLGAVDSTTQEFQFFKCDPPTGKYAESTPNKVYGQLRSTKHPDMCVTSGNVQIVTGSSGGWVDTKSYPTDDGTITLQPCATDHNLALRLQWFSQTRKPNCPDALAFEGWKSDYEGTAIKDNNGATLFYHPFKSWSDYYMTHSNGNVPSQC